MGIRVFGHWLFGKPDYAKKMEEIKKLDTEIREIKWMIDRETVRFHQEMNQIASESKIRSNEIFAASERELDRIDENGTPVLKEAEITLFLANVDSELAANMQDTLRRLEEAKSRHDAEMAHLLGRRDDCRIRLNELMEECHIRPGEAVDNRHTRLNELVENHHARNS